MTTTPSGFSMSPLQAYHEKMFNLLSDRDPFEVLAQTASALADIVSKHPAAILGASRICGSLPLATTSASRWSSSKSFG
jgi:hypothetical protein